MPPTDSIIDVNITLGQWPTRRVPCDDVNQLVEKLRAHDVAEAWAGHYDGLFHTDLTDVNNHLAAACTTRVPLAPQVLPSNRRKQLPSENPPPKLVPFGESTFSLPTGKPISTAARTST